jgi:hypothetical protein
VRAPPVGSDEAAAWGTPSAREVRWPLLVAMAIAIGLQFALPNQVTGGFVLRITIPALEALLLVLLAVANPGELNAEERALRALGLALIALVTLMNVFSLGQLIDALLYGVGTGGRSLVYASVPIWLTNVIAFGVWFWELDRGGPAARCQPTHRKPDFLFPQMANPGVDPSWAPRFSDYLYTSFTNATAFSPTDTLPLTAWAKTLMGVQSMLSLLTVALVVSRAVNILR